MMVAVANKVERDIYGNDGPIGRLALCSLFAALGGFIGVCPPVVAVGMLFVGYALRLTTKAGLREFLAWSICMFFGSVIWKHLLQSSLQLSVDWKQLPLAPLCLILGAVIAKFAHQRR